MDRPSRCAPALGSPWGTGRPSRPPRSEASCQARVQVSALGALLVPVQLAMKPKVVEDPAPTLPFQLSLLTFWVEPLGELRPPQIWVICWLLGNVQLTRQPLRAADPAVTVTSPWNPPCHWLVMRYVAAQVPGVWLVGVAVGLVGGGVVGVVVGLDVGVVGVTPL